MFTFVEFINLISLVVAATSLGFGAYVYYRGQEEAKLRQWQKVTIFAIISDKTIVSFSEIKQAYRNEAMAIAGIKVSKNELSEFALHGLLYELIRERLIVKNSSDYYELSKFIKSDDGQDFESSFTSMMSDAFAGLTALASNSMDISTSIFHTVSEDPYKFTVSELTLKVAEQTGQNSRSVSAEIAKALSKGELKIDDSHKIGIVTAVLK